MILFVDKDTTLFRSSSIRYRGWLYEYITPDVHIFRLECWPPNRYTTEKCPAENFGRNTILKMVHKSRNFSTFAYPKPRWDWWWLHCKSHRSHRGHRPPGGCTPNPSGNLRLIPACLKVPPDFEHILTINNTNPSQDFSGRDIVYK